MYAVIIAGGYGTRLWPMSRMSSPKQFLPLINDLSSFQETFERLLSAVGKDKILVQAGTDLEEIIRSQINLESGRFIAEPEMRDNGPAILLAALKIKSVDADAPMAVIWADHNVEDKEAFSTTLKAAEKAVTDSPDSLVTVGVKPDSPETGLGYINTGEKVNSFGTVNILKVNKFIEKPDLQTAKKFVESGDYLWNTGYKIFMPSWIIAKFIELYPQYKGAIENLEKAIAENNSEKLAAAYKELPKESIEYLITEKIDNILVVPAEFDWIDVGNWQILHKLLSKSDKNKMVVRGDHIGHNDENCLIYADHKIIATVGLKDIVIVDTPDITLVCNKNYAHDVKEIINKLKAEGKHIYL